MSETVSIIIPALNEERALPQTLRCLRLLSDGPVEIIVADGGSTDGTVQVAESFGAKIVRGAVGRGAQQRAGALAATGEILWFLHADTYPTPNALGYMREALKEPAVVAGHFRLRFSGGSFAAKFVTGYQPLLRQLKLIYGDSAIFVRRDAYFAVGGFAALPLFEDLDLVRRLRMQGEFRTVAAEVVTSSRRFEGRLGRTLLQWLVLQALYSAGTSPEKLASVYRHLR
jgi:rSAM/selenodomain-associated transferase 2